MNILEFLPAIDPLISLILILFSAILALAVMLVGKTKTISILKNKLGRLDKIIQDLDQQAKMIIKGDMELKLSQQEIEDKINRLTLIKNLIVSSVHTLDKEKLFAQINEKVINDLGFKKGLVLDFDDLKAKVNVNFSNREINILKSMFQYKKELFKEVQLLHPEAGSYRQILPSLQNEEILIAPIKVRNHVYAIFTVSKLLKQDRIKRSEEETFLIVCMYLSQCLDNIRLFEDLYHTKDNLEKKIKERTKDLVKSLREIEVINKAKSDFVSSVSHELRTPLTSVKGFSSLLVMEKFGKLSPEAKKRLEKIDVNVNKLVDMVNMLLDISRIESGKTEVKIAATDIVKVIKDSVDLLTPQINSKNIQILTELPKSLNVLADKNLIERVLINLLNNSIKFTPEKGKITVKCSQQEGRALIAVSDNGVGIAKDDLEKVFGEFYRTQATSGMPGTGLGLSLVKRIIDTHREKIWVESQLDKGTTFYFTLKLEKNV